MSLTPSLDNLMLCCRTCVLLLVPVLPLPKKYVTNQNNKDVYLALTHSPISRRCSSLSSLLKPIIAAAILRFSAAVRVAASVMVPSATALSYCCGWVMREVAHLGAVAGDGRLAALRCHFLVLVLWCRAVRHEELAVDRGQQHEVCDGRFAGAAEPGRNSDICRLHLGAF